MQLPFAWCLHGTFAFSSGDLVSGLLGRGEPDVLRLPLPLPFTGFTKPFGFEGRKRAQQAAAATVSAGAVF